MNCISPEEIAKLIAVAISIKYLCVQGLGVETLVYPRPLVKT